MCSSLRTPSNSPLDKGEQKELDEGEQKELDKVEKQGIESKRRSLTDD